MTSSSLWPVLRYTWPSSLAARPMDRSPTTSDIERSCEEYASRTIALNDGGDLASVHSKPPLRLNRSKVLGLVRVASPLVLCLQGIRVHRPCKADQGGIAGPVDGVGAGLHMSTHHHVGCL